MSAHLTQARKNRILALRTVAARNSDPISHDGDDLPAFRSVQTAPLSVVDSRSASPWQPEGTLAA